MCTANNAKSYVCDLKSNISVTQDIFILQFDLPAAPSQNFFPRAGQFYMLKHERGSVFLPRPISIFEYDSRENSLKFLIAKHGRGTEELSQLCRGEKVRLTGPFGNYWSQFLPADGKVALVGGSLGLAPMAALVAENPDYNFHFYAGFKNGFEDKEKENTVLGAGLKAKKIFIAAEDGRNAQNGRIMDIFYDPKNYDAVFGCGPMPMLHALKEKCVSNNVPCYISVESRMACGAGACLGCTVRTAGGNKRCCADGPIFPAGEVVFQ
jgi:NAD(P)H-flavin reductase